MVATNDGFKIAEVDLELRGSGELFGMRQAGEANFMMLDVVHDTELLIFAREDTSAIVQSDPNLLRDEHKKIKNIFQKRFQHLLSFVRSG